MEVELFFNPAAAAGRSAMRLGATLATLRTLGARVRLHRPSSADRARQDMAVLANKAERLVVVGGDGMVHQAANALAGSSTVLGIIPAGTGNDAATSFGIPNDVEGSCKAALRDGRAVDVIESDAGLAVTVVTGGLSVAVNDRANAMRRVKGAMKYTLASVLELPRAQQHKLTLVLDGVEHVVQANLIAIANTPYFGGGMKVAPNAELNNGMLDVVVIGPASRGALARILPTAFSGRHVNSKHVAVHRAAEIQVRDSSMTFRADGEHFGQAPVTLRVKPAALLVAGAQI